MTVAASKANLVGTRFVPWLVRFRRVRRGQAELELRRIDEETFDPRASEAATDSLRVVFRGRHLGIARQAARIIEMKDGRIASDTLNKTPA